MRFEIESMFLAVAEQLKCWIAFPEPPAASDRWMGKAGYSPKCDTCWAPVSDDPNCPFAGLVMDPTTNPAAFCPETLSTALEDWQRFTDQGQLPPGYGVQTDGEQVGLVSFGGNLLYETFDLLTVYNSDAQANFRATTPLEREQLFRGISCEINRRLGTTLLLPSSQLLEHVGLSASSFPLVRWYGPNRRSACLPGTMRPL
ncbi:MAG: hypothetical protein NXI32_20285 [bacterium]|nr:hypothetical protein [bacterium]